MIEFCLLFAEVGNDPKQVSFHKSYSSPRKLVVRFSNGTFTLLSLSEAVEVMNYLLKEGG